MVNLEDNSKLLVQIIIRVHNKSLMVMHLMALEPVAVVRYIYKSIQQLSKSLGGKLGSNIEKLSLMLRKMDASVLGVINFMQCQRHCFNALHVMTAW